MSELRIVPGTWIEHPNDPTKEAVAFQCPNCQLTLVESIPEEILKQLSEACPCCGKEEHVFVMCETSCEPPCNYDLSLD